MDLLTRRPRGTNDVLPGESPRWLHIEDRIRDVCGRFGFSEIRTPIFEHADLYTRTSGETSDILEKETYTFQDRGRRMLTLRPEGTPGVARAFLENGLGSGPMPAKYYYLGPMFRYDRPQAGRYRQHTQFGVEIIGAPGPEADFEVIMIAVTFLRDLGLGSLAVHLNSIGCPACRPTYREALVSHYRAAQEELCEDCRRRLERNPLRLLDCKNPRCQPLKDAAPRSVNYLCPECQSHFRALEGLLDRFGIEHHIDLTLVRGLDYYTRTVFELIYHGLGAQGAVCGGGRYDGLIEAIGGPPTPGVGYGMGLERVLLTLEREGMHPPSTRGTDIAVLSAAGEEHPELRLQTLDLVYAMRWAGLAAETDYAGRGLRQQMRWADRIGARLVTVVGSEEIASGQVKVKDMAGGTETQVPLAELVARVSEMVRGPRT
ncbi:MAG: histidine--tRNA ligase [Bacillota bacterium]|nr:histidine--tRNA ligase [Bacillota bacterium]